MTGAENQDTALTFERDAVGRIVKEAQGDHWISSTYDELGNRINFESSLGTKVVLNHNQMGQVSLLAGAQAGNKAWTAQMSYNALGQEELRKVSGGVISEWQYDSMGRVKSHRVGSNDRDSRRRKYDWDVNQRLKSITDDLNNKRTTFSYDQFSNLVKADYGFGDILSRESDDVGNLYEKADKSDRIYGKGSRLEKSKVNTNELKNQFQGGRGKLVTEGVEYSYDGEGNLIKKAEPNGNITKYDYYGNGMLKEVTKPDGETVSFKYDSLGRRIEKSSDSNIIKFVWDGNNPLHEWEEENRQESLTTWIFDEGSFVPSAKMTNQGNYSIITDHLGTPVEAYDEDGEKVWEQELDIYGRVKPRPVVKEWGQVVDDGMFGEHFIPFRYQGQYSDKELNGELYYSRYRYYDPQLGQYITQDPIGLDGNNPTLYAYVPDSNTQIDPLGLWWWSHKIIGNAQTTGTAGHAFLSKLHANLNAMNPNVVRVTMDLGYKKLLGDGAFKWGPRPDVGVLYKNGNVKIIEVASKTDNIQNLVDRNKDWMDQHNIKGKGKNPVKVNSWAKRFDSFKKKLRGCG